MNKHIPVLLQEVLEGLALDPGDVVLDATVGGGGYTEALCEAVGANGTVVGVDADVDAVERTQRRLSDAECTLHLVEANFRTAGKVLSDLGITALDGAVFDLGLSSYQLDSPEGEGRGFSFKQDEPLLMTFKKHPSESDLTAEFIVNTWEEEPLVNALRGYGEERYAPRIARAIIEARREKPITTTGELVSVIEKAVPAQYRHGRIHPATRTFQALRIATNDEMQALEDGLKRVYKNLKDGGRMAVVSFHSLEDRIAKHFMKKRDGEMLTKKPITPTEEEIAENPRARSAKLRIIEKHS